MPKSITAFISYPRALEHVAAEVASQLRTNGYSVWIDVNNFDKAADARSQLKKAIEVAAVEARANAQRLSAVEEQVRVAVTKLEKAHVQLHAQGEALQTQSNIIYRVEQALREAVAAQDSKKLIEEVLQIVTSREQASSF